MANEYVVHNYARVDVNEHRAPTDKSVKLLREMEKAALEEVVKTVRVRNTEFDGVIHKMTKSFDMTTLYRCVFKLNGKQMSVEYEADNLDHLDDAEARVIGIRNAIAEKIANEILKPIINNVAEPL